MALCVCVKERGNLLSKKLITCIKIFGKLQIIIIIILVAIFLVVVVVVVVFVVVVGI